MANKKGIDLCYVKNYTRPIPTDVIEKIGEANELEVYDNFVVLHYDPNGLNKKETRKFLNTLIRQRKIGKLSKNDCVCITKIFIVLNVVAKT